MTRVRLALILFLVALSLAAASYAQASERRVPKLTIPVPKNNSLVQKYIKQYESAEARAYLSAIMKRSTPYRSFILAEADRLSAPDFLLYLPVIESGFSERAVSKAGAVGI